MPEADNTHTPIPRSVLTGFPPAATLTAMPPATPEQVLADQDLIQLCAQHIGNRAALDSCPLDADDSPHWPPFAASSDAISIARPASLAELAAKARAAKREALTVSGQEDASIGSALDWAWDLVNDLIRLDAGTA